MKKITAGQVHKALVDSIDLRWKPLADGISIYDVPDCQLCDLFPFDGFQRNPSHCTDCPLSLIGQCCVTEAGENGKSAWGKYHNSLRYSPYERKCIRNMIVQLQKCLDTFFPAGLAKK